jgi:STE24 endopeptidase
MNAKKYNNIKLGIGIAKSVLSFVLIILFVSFGYSSMLVNYLESIVSGNYLILILFTIITSIFLSILFFPVKYYVEFYLEHKYQLSNQTVFSWLWEDAKGIFVGILIGFPILLAFYYALETFNSLWWLPFSILMFIISVVLAKIVPVIILPIFYKIEALKNEDLKSRILTLAKDVGMKVENVFSFNMSKNTKKANAAFTGLGKTKRILLGDTLLNDYSNDEIETVIAHELGHYKHKHILKNIVISTVTSFLLFFLIATFYDISLEWFGFSYRTQIDALPLLSIWAMLIGLVLTPIGNIISRKFEYEADNFAIHSTNKKEAFIETLNKLTEQNLGDKEPHPLVEWFFYSHPSIKKRVANLKSQSVKD